MGAAAPTKQKFLLVKKKGPAGHVGSNLQEAYLTIVALTVIKLICLPCWYFLVTG